MKFLRSFTATLLLLVATVACAADADRNGNGNDYEDVPSGTLILPGEREATGRESTADRKCMKVCKEWGETCIIDPAPAAGNAAAPASGLALNASESHLLRKL
ncbi:MAG: hypothetical protein U5P41_15180 [Gammaproteobacteria bacterium]|nr:hypothetical protein [Gammaproteobacteria bacterium]